MKMFHKLFNKVRRKAAKYVWKKWFPWNYAHYVYWQRTNGKELSWNHPCDINEKLFWLHRYWQHPLVVLCADKLTMRDYVKQCGLETLLTRIYAVYENANQINFKELPGRFVLKCNHGSGFNIICKDKESLNINDTRKLINQWLGTTIGFDTAEYHYQYIPPKAYVEEYIGDENDERLEIQFFCFNGQANHILVRNDLGDAARQSFAISYDRQWSRVHDRINEDMSITIPRPDNFDKLIEYAERLAKPFPHVRVDFYLVGNNVYVGELTFTTHGNILSNYTEEVLRKWGDELVLPKKLKNKWHKEFKSYARS